MSDQASSRKILIVDDEEIIVDILKRRFGRMGFSVYSAMDGQEAVDLLSKQKMDLVVCDVLLPNDISGEEVLEVARDQNPDSHFVAMSGHILSDDSVQSLMAHGADLFIKKPFPSLSEVTEQMADLVS